MPLCNVEEHTQRHYTGHSSEIRALTVYPDRIQGATGQSASSSSGALAHIRIWDSINLTTVKTIGLNGEFGSGICIENIACLSFSKHDSGKYLASVVVQDSPRDKDRLLSVRNLEKKDNNKVYHHQTVVATKCSDTLVFLVVCIPHPTI